MAGISTETSCKWSLRTREGREPLTLPTPQWRHPMKLTVTQAKLLKRAARNTYNGSIAIQTGFITSRSGCPTYGTRDFNAATKLAEAGLLRKLGSSSSIHQLSHQFGADHGSEHSYCITEAGSQAIAK